MVHEEFKSLVYARSSLAMFHQMMNYKKVYLKLWRSVDRIVLLVGDVQLYAVSIPAENFQFIDSCALVYLLIGNGTEKGEKVETNR